MDADRFWELIDSVHAPHDLHTELALLSDSDLASFERRHDALFHGSYDWDLWGAAFIIDGGCSNDGFDYFRAYLISLGRDRFDAALADPDSLAEIDLHLAEEPEREAWMSPTMGALHRLIGRHEFATDLDDAFRWPRSPSGRDWTEDELPARLPRLAAKYGRTAL